MTPDRRFSDEEIEEILERASRMIQGRLLEQRGLTLAQLQEVGIEAGLDPNRIAAAARFVDARRGAQPRRMLLGAPVAIGRTVDLPREPSPGEWDQLVAELQSTFRARGQVTTSSGAREWSNGNLRVTVFPGPQGARLQLQTIHGNGFARGWIGAAGMLLSVSLVVGEVIATAAGSSILTGDLWTWRGMAFPLVVAGISGVLLGANLIQLPRWARLREGQMERVGDWFRSRMDTSPPGEASS